MFCKNVLHMFWRSSVKKLFIKISQNLHENTCATVSFFNTVAGLNPTTLLKARLLHWCFPVSFEKILRTNAYVKGCFWKFCIGHKEKTDAVTHSIQSIPFGFISLWCISYLSYGNSDMFNSFENTYKQSSR